MRSKILARTAPLLAACMPLAAIAAADESPLPGLWQRHEYVLSHTGFTSSYTCDGIAQKVRLLLLAAGARDDLKVVGRCSSAIGGPSRIATARATFSTLSPAPGSVAPAQPAEGKPEAAPEPGIGVWKTVELRERTPSWLGAGDCELVEQFDRELLPFFATRDHQAHMTCTLGEYALGAISLRFQSFAPLPTARTGSAATPQ
jgi:hypothetical protein